MRSTLLIVAGVVMLASAVAHGALGWPSIKAGLDAAGAGPDLAGALSVGWYWGSASMVAFGIVTAAAGFRLRRGDRSGLPAVGAIAACYVGFGAAAFVLRDLNPHFLLFVATGLLAGLPALGAENSASPAPEP